MKAFQTVLLINFTISGSVSPGNQAASFARRLSNNSKLSPE